MDSRKVKICYFLAQNKNVLLSQISKVFNKSERTIRNDIENINIFLRSRKINNIIIENNLVNFDVSPIEIFYLLNQLSYADYYLDSIERRVVIILYGLIKKDYFTINELTKFMHVSRSTVINDFDSIKKFISSYNYDLITEPSIGTIIKELKNSKKNDLIKDLLDFDINNISRFFNQKKISKSLHNSISYNYINEISDLIVSVENDLDVSLTEYSFRLLKYYIAIYIQTFEKNETEKTIEIKKDFTFLLIHKLKNEYNIFLVNMKKIILENLLTN